MGWPYVVELLRPLLNSTQLLFDLQQVTEIGRRLSGCLEAEAIAKQVTDALVQRFNCAFARIWLTEPNQTYLRLVASSGLYTHTDGDFARVPMGAYKVGKIAQNRVSFLSNALADEPWVKDREWAIANQIQGFAGYPLIAGDRVLGVLATFSQQAMAPEFLEVLQVLCLTTTIALDAALQVQRQSDSTRAIAPAAVALSDQLAALLAHTRLMLVGTERPLSAAMVYLMLHTAELLNQLQCRYCRLMYGPQEVALEAIAAYPQTPAAQTVVWPPQWEHGWVLTTWLGGTLQTQIDPATQVVEVLLKLPYPTCAIGMPVVVRSQWPLVRTVLTQLCCQAGLPLGAASQPGAIWLTDDVTEPPGANPVIWIQHRQGRSAPSHAKAVIDLWTEPDHLHQVIQQVAQGKTVTARRADLPQRLSDREQEVMVLLAQGLRDREIAKHLHISESTVKFHINNTLTKLNAKNRYQAVYEATVRQWI